MKGKTKKLLLGGAAVVVVGVAGTYLIGSNPIMIGASFINIFRGSSDPEPSMKYELKAAAEAGDFGPNPMASGKALIDPGKEWPAFNRTVYGDRYSPLDEINIENASKLQVVCSFDTHLLEGNQSAPIMVEDTLIYTSTKNTYALDPATCEEKWRAHENTPLGIMPVNRGVAYIDGKIIRGHPDGFMRAYGIKTGDKLWETYISDKSANLWLTMAPVAWNGMVYAGLAGGDVYNNRGRIVGLDAATGEIKWQTFTVPWTGADKQHAKLGKVPEEEMRASWQNPTGVPVSGGGVWTTISVDPQKGHIYVPIGNPAPDFVKEARPGSNLFTNTMLVLDAATGDYANHLSIMKYDWHDWDMSNAPSLVRTRGGKDLVSFAPKDGHLYGFDRNTSERFYREPKTKILNADVEFEPGKEYYFCPGSVGGGEWNGTAYDPKYNLIFTGMNEWCAHAKIKPLTEAEKKPTGGIWFGVAYFNPYNLVGKTDPPTKWGGWLYASDADTGDWKWRIRANYPILSGLTPTAGGITAFGDAGGMLRIARTDNGEILLEKKFDGGLVGGLITYESGGKQYIAFPSGLSHPQWPVQPNTSKIVVMGLN